MDEFSHTQSSNSEINGLYLSTEKDGKTLLFPKAELPADFRPKTKGLVSIRIEGWPNRRKTH